MKAFVQDGYGPPDVLKLTEVEKPVPRDNQVVVRVHAAALNARDWHMMRGDPYIARMMSPSVFGFAGPKMKIRGSDFAGQVEAVGSGVTRFRPGDDVYGDAGAADGAFAEYLRVSEHLVETKPAKLTFEQAAAVPLAGNTALICVRDAGQVQPGQHVLINGASGGVGTFAVQIARSFGAQVTGVCSNRNVDLVRSIGTEHVIDYTREDFTRKGRRYDVVLDLVGNRSLSDLRRAVTPTGTLLLSGGGVSRGGSFIGPMRLIIGGMVLSRFVRHQRLVVVMAAPNRQNLATLRELIESGQVTPVIDRTYPLSKVPEAIRYLEVEHARAKVVIKIVD
jgi:NADPH:quinone reductase-like Zn-dependent oxidoreductase